MRYINGSIFHVLYRNSQLFKRTANSFDSTKPLAAGVTLEMGLIARDAFETLLLFGIHFALAVDSKALYISFSTTHVSTETEVMPDVRLDSYCLDTSETDRMIWS